MKYSCIKMENDCDIYVDPEEDEVFFGCMTEKEKNICAEMVKHAGSSPKSERKVNKNLDEGAVISFEENSENRLYNELSNNTSLEVFTNDLSDSELALKKVEKDVEKSDVIIDASFESEECFSTPLQNKMEKSNLITPTSIVNDDQNEDFLPVLSEIALVKIETETDSTLKAKKEDEDKENHIISPIPEIKITEATPEKPVILSSSKNVNSELRRFRIIYNSPQNEKNVDYNYKSNSFAETFESKKNFKNKCLDQDIDKILSRDNKSVDLIEFNDFESGVLNVSISLDEEEKDIQSLNADGEIEEVTVLEEHEHVSEIISPSELIKPLMSENIQGDLKPMLKVKSQPPVGVLEDSNPFVNLRFSKDAKKVIEILKKSSVDDILNFTVTEIDTEKEENSFVSPEPVSIFEETVISNKDLIIRPEKMSPKILIKPADNKLSMKLKTVEKDRRQLTPVVSQRKLLPVKSFSERRICTKNESDTKKKCAKKLLLEEKKPASAESVRDGRMGEGNVISSSKIPLFGAKNSKIPVTERVARPFAAKSTPAKTPSGKIYKNSKFTHIESPINAYIHNKPTSLVLNIKPEVKKDSLTKLLKAQSTGKSHKVSEKTPNQQKHNNTNEMLPFVEYKSATPYKIEKRQESRLPRLAPNVMKLIGTHSPKVLKHEGRFYLNAPRKQSSAEATILADPNEVSIVVSQPVQKSNAIK